MATRKQKPAMEPSARQAQLIGLAFDFAEKQLMDGTAPAATVNHFLKLATEKEKLDRAKIEYELELLKAKTESLESSKQSAEAYTKAIEAMTQYSGK